MSLFDFSLKDLGASAGFGAAIGAGIGALFGPEGSLAGAALGGAVEGAVDGIVSYLAGSSATKVAKVLGATEKEQDLAGLVASIALPSSGAIFRKAPNLLKEAIKGFTASAAGGFLGWSFDDDNPERGFLIGAFMGGSVSAAAKMIDLEKIASELGNSIVKKVPGFKRFTAEIPEVSLGLEAPVEGLSFPFRKIAELELNKPLGLRETIARALSEAAGATVQNKELIEKLKATGLKPWEERSLALGQVLGYGTDYSYWAILKEHHPEVADVVETFIDVLSRDAEFFESSGLLPPGIHKAFMWVSEEANRLQVHIPVTAYFPEKVEVPPSLLGRKGRLKSMMTQSVALKEAGKMISLNDKLLEKLKLSEVPEVGTRVIYKDREWTVIERDGKPYLHRKYTPDEYEEIAKNKIAAGEWPEGTMIAPDFVSGVIKYVSERTGLYKRALVLSRLETLLQENGLIFGHPTPFANYKIPDIRLEDQWRMKAFGNLSGKYTTKEIGEALENLHKAISYRPGSLADSWLGDITRRWASLTNVWKKWYLGLNWKSYMTQAIGDVALTLVNGFNPAKVLRKGLEAVLDPAFMQEFQRFGGDYIGIEQDVLMQGLRYVAGRVEPHSKLSSAFSTIDSLGDKLIELFGFTDKIFRAGLTKQFAEQGLAMPEAIAKAKEVLPTYEMLPAGIKTLRDTIFPFVSFSYVTLPKVLQAAARNPEGFITLLAFVEGLQYVGWREMYGNNWREGRKLEKLVNEKYSQPTLGGFMADYIRVPSLGRIPGGYMSIGWVPWNLPFSIPSVVDASKPTNWLAVLFLQHPLLKTIIGFGLNLDVSSGRTVRDLAGPGRDWASLVQWGLRNLAPTVPFTGRYGLQLLAEEGWLSPLTSWFNAFGVDFAGKPYELEHLLWNQLLPTIRRFDPTYKAKMEIYRIQNAIEEHKKGLVKLLYRGADKETLAKRIKQYQEWLLKQRKKEAEIISAYKEGYHHPVSGS